MPHRVPPCACPFVPPARSSAMEALMISSTNAAAAGVAATGLAEGIEGIEGIAPSHPLPHALPPPDLQVPAISCVIPCFNEGANLRHLLPRLEEILWATKLRWE